MIFKTGHRIIKTGNGIIYSISRPLIKKPLLQSVSHLFQGVQNWFSKQEMELSKQEMELFLLFPGLRSKNFFYKMFFISTKEFRIDSQNRKRNNPNRKWIYLSHFQASDQKTSFTKCFSFKSRSSELIFKTGNGIIQTGNGIIYPFSGL